MKRSGRGRPKQRPGRVVGDKAYSSRRIRGHLRRRGIRITIPHKENEHRSGPFDRAIYRLRERVERLINRLKQNRRIATRYDKCADNYRLLATFGELGHDGAKLRAKGNTEEVLTCFLSMAF